MLSFPQKTAVTASAMLALSGLLGGAEASAQCAPQPTVAYAPVVPQAVAYPAPAVYQTTLTQPRWYPGKYLADFTRSLFGGPRTSTTYTAAYPAVAAPMAPAGPYAATPYTAGYAPSLSLRTAYRPTYPATYGPVVPTTQTLLRPVTLAPAMSYSAPDACGCGVTRAVYDAPLSTGCSSCGPATSYTPAPAASDRFGPSLDQQPTLAPNENPPPVRSDKPELGDPNEGLPVDDGMGLPEDEPAFDGAYWQTAPRFTNPDRVTQRTLAPRVRQAVYRPTTDASARRAGAHQLGATGWSAVD